MTTTRGLSFPTAPGSDASSISKSPRSPLGSADQFVSATSADATPRSRLDPERLWIGSHPAVRFMSASIRAVVGFPFVLDTKITQCGRDEDSAPIKLGSTVRA